MEDVNDFLGGIGMSEYADVFEENGWDCLRALKTMKEVDVTDIVNKKGHVRMILTELQTLNAKRSASPSQEAGPSKKSRPVGQAESKFQFGGITFKVPATTPAYQKLSIYYKNPKYPRNIFSNEQLPIMYDAAFKVLPKPKFESYFREEVQQRWDDKERIRDIEAKISFLQGDNTAAVGKFMDKLPSNIKPQHIGDIKKGIKKLSDIQDVLTGIESCLQDKLQKLYDGAVLKRWATEQQSYCETKITQIRDIVDTVDELKEKLAQAESRVSAMFLTRGRDNSKKSRRKKENKKTTKKRRLERQQSRIQAILNVIAPGTDAHEMEEWAPICEVETCEGLEKCLTKSSLMKGLDDLVDENALSIGLRYDIQKYLKDKNIDWEF